MVGAWAAMRPGLVSNRLIVGNETSEASASWRCSHRSNARAARSCSLVSEPEVLFDPLGIDTRLRRNYTWSIVSEAFVAIIGGQSNATD